MPVASPTAPDSEGPEWRAAVSVEEDSALGREITARLPPVDTPRPVSVSDLLAPRRAFWRAQGPPVSVSPEREARREEGRRLHRVLGLALADEGVLEVRVRAGPVHGRVDLLTDRPVEVKTSSSPLPGPDLIGERPDHVDQLGMYCTLLGREVGRLLYVHVADESVDEVRAVDLRFRGLEGMRAEMGARAEALRRALADGRPGALPRCPWFGRGCEYQQAGRCDCRGSEPVQEPVTASRVEAVEPQPEVAARLAHRISELPGPMVPFVLDRFRDLLYPRRAFFEREPEAPKEPKSEALWTGASELYRRLLDAVEAGPVGESSRLPTRSEGPEEEVAALGGAPYLVRTSQSSRRLAPAEWMRRAPQYGLELGFRCVATGTRRAWLIVGYERAEDDRHRVQVLGVNVSPTPFARLWRARVDALAHATSTGDPAGLPACPAWMFENCPYRAACGCGSPEGRVQWKRTVDEVRRNPSES